MPLLQIIAITIHKNPHLTRCSELLINLKQNVIDGIHEGLHKVVKSPLILLIFACHECRHEVLCSRKKESFAKQKLRDDSQVS